MQKTRPKLSRRLVTLNLDNDQAARLDRLGAPRGQKAGDFVADLLSPLLEAENAEELYWYLIALNGPDNALIGKVCRKKGSKVDEVLDIIVGDALEHLDV
jgi:hypothetical protein